MTRPEIQLLIDAIQDNTPNTALEVRTILNALADGAIISNQVIQIDVATSYIADNFDSTGLGINERVGYAICNGNNGTRDWRNRIPLQYDATNYPTLGAVGGNNSVTLASSNIPELTANFTGSNADNGDSGSYLITANSQSNGAKTLPVNTGSANTAIDIRQPYIVTLFIMKL